MAPAAASASILSLVDFPDWALFGLSIDMFSRLMPRDLPSGVRVGVRAVIGGELICLCKEPRETSRIGVRVSAEALD